MLQTVAKIKVRVDMFQNAAKIVNLEPTTAKQRIVELVSVLQSKTSVIEGPKYNEIRRRRISGES